MDHEHFNPAMGGPRYLTVQQSMEQRYVAVDEELYNLKSQIQLLLEQNRYLTELINHRIKNEMSLESAFRDIRDELAEAQQVLDQIGTIARAGATRGRREHSLGYDEMLAFVRNLSHENRALKDKLCRERELLTEAKQAAAESATHHRKVTTGLMAKLRSLQKRGEPLYDDECASEWRKLQQALKSWIMRTFRDESAMSTMTLEDLRWAADYVKLPEAILQNIRGKRAYIQGVIAGFIFDTVFDSFFAFSPSTRSEKLLRAIGQIVRAAGSSHTWETWRSATSQALNNRAAFENHRLDDSCNQLLGNVESLFGEYYNPTVQKETAHKALQQIFEACLSFKSKLERQEFDYVIRQSPPGTVYSTEKVKSLNFMEEDGSIVEMSVWPSLYKLSFDNEELLIEPEVVWTKKPIQVDNPGMEDVYDIEKEIKQEVKTEEDDDDELSLVML